MLLRYVYFRVCVLHGGQTRAARGTQLTECFPIISIRIWNAERQKHLWNFFCIGYATITVRRVGGSVLCGRGRRITENIRVEVDGALARGTDAAVVFKWSLEHGNSIIHGLETSSIHLYPSLPLSLQAPAPIVCLNGLLPPHLSPLLRLIVIPSAILSPHFSYLWTVHC